MLIYLHCPFYRENFYGATQQKHVYCKLKAIQFQTEKEISNAKSTAPSHRNRNTPTDLTIASNPKQEMQVKLIKVHITMWHYIIIYNDDNYDLCPWFAQESVLQHIHRLIKVKSQKFYRWTVRDKTTESNSWSWNSVFWVQRIVNLCNKKRNGVFAISSDRFERSVEVTSCVYYINSK